MKKPFSDFSGSELSKSDQKKIIGGYATCTGSCQGGSSATCKAESGGSCAAGDYNAFTGTDGWCSVTTPGGITQKYGCDHFKKSA